MPRDLQARVIKTFGEELGAWIIDEYTTYFQSDYSEMSLGEFDRNCHWIANAIGQAE